MRAQKERGGHEPLDIGDTSVRFEKLEEDLRSLNTGTLGDSSSRAVCRIRKANSWFKQPNLSSGINVCNESVVYHKKTHKNPRLFLLFILDHKPIRRVRLDKLGHILDDECR